MKVRIGWNLIEKALVVLLLLASVGAAVDYPQFFQGKFCYDETGTLTNDQWTALNQRLLDYQAQTTNEVLVVITQDLQGQEAPDYAKGLFNKWAIGRYDVNNGVLIVVYRGTLNGEESDNIVIQRGDGIADYVNEDDFYDEVAAYLWEGDERNWYNGLDAGLNYLEGNLPSNWPGTMAVAAEQSSQPYQPTASSPSNDRNGGSTIIVILIIVVGGTLLFLLARAVMSSRVEAKREAERKIQAAADYQAENSNMVGGLKDLLMKLERSVIPAQTALNGLRDNHPESVWGMLVEPFKEINVDLLNSLKREIDIVEFDARQNEKPEAVRNTIGELVRRLTGYIQICDQLVERLDAAGRFESEAKSALDHLPERIDLAEKEVDHPDVGDRLRGSLQLIRKAFFEKQAAVLGKTNKDIDWIQLNEALKVISGDVAQAVDEARLEKERAEKARSEGPKLLAKLPEIEAALSAKEIEYKDSASAQTAIAATRAEIARVREASSDAGSINWLPVYAMLQTVESHHSEADNAFHRHNLRIAEEREEARRLAVKKAQRSNSGDLHGGRSTVPSSSRRISSTRPSSGTTGGGRSTTSSHGRRM